MKCLIIAAGQGSRLQSLAASKPLAPVAGRPLIEHVIRRARAGGASDFIVVTGFAAAAVEAFVHAFAAAEGISLACVRNEQWPRPNGLSVVAAAPQLAGEFLLLMADHLFDPAVVAMLAREESGAALTLAVDRGIDNPLIDLDDATKVEVGEGGRIVRLGKALARYNAIDVGLFRAGPSLVEAIRASVAAGGSGSLSEGVQRLADAGEARALDIGGRWWIDVDDPRAHRIAEERFGGAEPIL
ncbi:MAG: NTP transferase domain-containing protein [Pseudomonadota bacterium]|nr:NTP transferase domain-containing protein [Pseudomonadota bacterium]